MKITNPKAEAGQNFALNFTDFQTTAWRINTDANEAQ